MHREQTMDVFDTPAHDRRDWPSVEDFLEPEETLKWRDVQPGIYKILERFNQGQSKFGGALVVLKLESKNGTTFFCLGSFFISICDGKDAKHQIHLEFWNKSNRNGKFVLCFYALLSEKAISFMLYWTLGIFCYETCSSLCTLAVFLLNEYFTPVWQKNIRDITRELVLAMQEADKNIQPVIERGFPQEITHNERIQ